MIGFATERVRACSLFAPAGSLMASDYVLIVTTLGRRS
jgi:hypothetical protein